MTEPSRPARHGDAVTQQSWPTVARPMPSQPGIQVVRVLQPVYFDGGAGSYFGISVLGFAVTLFSAGILFPLAYVLRMRWRIEHTLIEGRRLRFGGTGLGLFGMWLKWWLFIVLTLGFYIFWVRPRLERWSCDHTTIAPPAG